jgi:hypothetical protein
MQFRDHKCTSKEKASLHHNLYILKPRSSQLLARILIIPSTVFPTSPALERKRQDWTKKKKEKATVNSSVRTQTLNQSSLYLSLSGISLTYVLAAVQGSHVRQRHADIPANSVKPKQKAAAENHAPLNPPKFAAVSAYPPKAPKKRRCCA